MDRPTCPKCHKVGVQSRRSARTSRPYLANVQTYDSGVSYFRSLHTDAECAEVIANRDAQVAEVIARDERLAAEREQGLRAQVLIPRYKAIHGEQALSANWERVAQRWLSLTFSGVA